MEDKFPIGDFVGVCVLGIEVGVWGGVDSCALGFRKGGEILDNMSKFVSHKIR